LIATARRLYADEPLGVELAQTAYALDSTTIELCLSVFPWARAPRTGGGAIKLHTLLDIRGAIPTILHLSEARWHDVHMLDRLIPEPGAIYVMDRGYLDFARLYRFHCEGAFFLMRAKHNLRVTRRYSHAVPDRDTIACDQTVVLSREVAHQDYPAPLRRLRARDTDAGGSIVLVTNHFALPATTVGALYRHRWQIEVFFKRIKQHLRIKVFFGTSLNAVKTQVWIAVSVYVLVAIVRKRLGSDASLYELLQILSLTLFEQESLQSILTRPVSHETENDPAKQLILFAD
jgi:hypothetical protein